MRFAVDEAETLAAIFAAIAGCPISFANLLPMPTACDGSADRTVQDGGNSDPFFFFFPALFSDAVIVWRDPCVLLSLFYLV